MITMGTTVSNNAKWHCRANKKFLEVQEPFYKKVLGRRRHCKRAGRRRHLE